MKGNIPRRAGWRPRGIALVLKMVWAVGELGLYASVRPKKVSLSVDDNADTARSMEEGERAVNMGNSDMISSPVCIGAVAKRPRFLPGAEASR